MYRIQLFLNMVSKDIYRYEKQIHVHTFVIIWRIHDITIINIIKSTSSSRRRVENHGSLQISSDLVRTSPHTLTAFSQKLNHAKKLKYNHLVADYDYNEYTTWVSQSYKTYKNFYRQIHFCKNISFKNYFLEFLDIAISIGLHGMLNVSLWSIYLSQELLKEELMSKAIHIQNWK